MEPIDMRWPISRPGIAFALVFVAVVLSAFGVGCSGSDGASESVSGGGADRFPSESLRDWVSYADHVVTFTVVSEDEIPPSRADAERGAGLVGREVTLRVDQTMWSAPDAPKLPSEIKMRALGWVLQDGKRLPATVTDAPRVEVGKRYLAPLVQVERDSGTREWWPLTVGSQLPVDGSRALSTSGTHDWDSPIRRMLGRRSIQQVDGLIEAQPPDPLAQRYRHLRPTERVQAVMSAKAASDGDGSVNGASSGPSRLRKKCDIAFRPLDRYVGPGQFSGGAVARRALPRIARALARMRPRLKAGLAGRVRGKRLISLLGRAERTARRGQAKRMVKNLDQAWLVAGRLLIPECHIGSAGRPS